MDRSAYEVANLEDHKDFRKMAVDMAACLIARIGALRDRDVSTRRSLRQFGLYVGGHQFQPCLMIPVFDDHNNPNVASLLFRCDPAWRGNLLSPPSMTVHVDDLEESPPLSNDREIEQMLRKADARNAATTGSIRLEKVDIDHVAANLRSVLSFCGAVQKQATFFKTPMEGGVVSDPFPYPSGFQTLPPSRPSLSARPHSQAPSAPAAKHRKRVSVMIVVIWRSSPSRTVVLVRRI